MTAPIPAAAVPHGSYTPPPSLTWSAPFPGSPSQSAIGTTGPVPDPAAPNPVTVSPGWKTTEFYTAVAVLVVGLIMVLTNHLDGTTYWAWAAPLVGLYGVGRGLAKLGTSA